MGVLTKSADIVYTLRFLRLLTTKWEDTNAFKLGLIDNEGKKLKKPVTTEEKSAYNTFHRLVFNIKKLINKVPGGKNILASYAAALLLIKENADLGEEAIQKILDELDIDPLNMLEESKWFITENRMLSPGEYRLSLHSPKMLNSTLEERCLQGDKVSVGIDNYPIKTICGVDIYEVTHTPTDQKIYVTTGELVR